MFLEGLGPFLIYAALVIAVVGIMLGLSFFLGQRINRLYKETPFESGIISVGSSQFRISVHFTSQPYFLLFLTWKWFFCLPGQWEFGRQGGLDSLK